MVTAQDVIAAWAAPGGPSAESWSGVAAVQTLLEAAGLPANGSTDLAIQLEPAMGLVQDAGTGTATVCVDFILTARVAGKQPDRVAAADCQHMTWHGDQLGDRSRRGGRTDALAVARDAGVVRRRLPVAGVPAMTAELVPMIDLNPFHWLGDQVKEGLADVFTAMMMSLWSAALWLMDLVFRVLDRFLTPDVTDPGLNHLYSVTLWLSLLVALLIGFGQVGVAAVRRDGRSLGALATGIAQYGAVVAGWIVVCGGLVVGCAGLTRGLLSEMLNVPGFPATRHPPACRTKSSARSKRRSSGSARCSW